MARHSFRLPVSTTAQIVVLTATLLACSQQVAMTEEQKIPVDKALLNQIVTAVKQGDDTYAAMAELEAAGEPAVVAEHYSQLLRQFYFQEKNVPQMVMFGRGGIGYALSQAKQLETTNPKSAEQLRGIAKTIAYNLGVNCWPGWRDEGITITASDRAAGYDAALLNLRLARELKRDAEILGHAHWLVGAHHLAAHRHADAIAEFNKSSVEFTKANKTDYQFMAAGYTALADQLSPNAAADAKQKYEAALAALKSRNTEDAKFFAEQIKTAAEVFAEP
ncbi:hypothetical protein [Symmachiella macrocystis]|nr:hypothetical protein [Symmachiella macrocystis]